MEIFEVLQEAAGNPWMLLYFSVWILGVLVKKYTKLPSMYIPWILTVYGAIMGLFIIDLTIGGAVLGAIMAMIQMGLYDTAQPFLTGR